MVLTAAQRKGAALAPSPAVRGAALTALSVLAFASAQGGYLPSSWRAGAVALAGGAALLRLWSAPVRITRATAALIALHLALAVFSFASAVWSIDANASLLDTQRTLLYVVALASFALAHEGLVAGVLAGGSGVGAWALVDRLVHGAPVDPYEGRLLTGPIGYANGLGALLAICIALSVALLLRERRFVHAAPLLVCVPALLLTGSRASIAACAVGCAAAAALAAGRRAIAGGVVAAAAGALAWLLLFTPAAAGERAAYWGVARDTGAAHLLGGTGAGTFHDVYRALPAARDAHSLYLQAWAELGAAGLLLVVALTVLPLLLAIRRGLAAPAAGLTVFALHAGVDWDWQLPAVTVLALAIGVVATASPNR